MCFLLLPKRPKPRTFVPKSTECYRDVNLILYLPDSPEIPDRGEGIGNPPASLWGPLQRQLGINTSSQETTLWALGDTDRDWISTPPPFHHWCAVTAMNWSTHTQAMDTRKTASFNAVIIIILMGTFISIFPNQFKALQGWKLWSLLPMGAT